MKGLIFTYVLTYGGAGAALFNPFWGLLVYICFATLRPESLWYWSVPAGNYSRIVAIGLLVGWAANGFGNWNLGRARPILLAVLGYWACIIASAIGADDQQVAWRYVELHSKILLPVVIGMTVVDTPQRLRALAWVLIGSLGFLALEGNLDYFRGGTRVLLQGMGGMDNNSFCIAMVLGAGIAFFLGLAETNALLKWTAFAAAGLMAHVPMFGQSRGAMLALCVLGLVTFLIIPKRPAHLAVLALGLIIALRLAGPSVWERFETAFASGADRDGSAQSRLDLWRDGWDVMTKYPLTGVGPDHWPLIAHTYGWPEGKEMHSIWVNAGAELGLPGMACLMGIYGLTIWLGIQHLRQRAKVPGQNVDVTRMAVAGIAAFLVAGSFVALDALEPPFYTIVLGACALKVADLRPATATSTTISNSGRLAAGPATLIVAASFVPFDALEPPYHAANVGATTTVISSVNRATGDADGGALDSYFRIPDVASRMIPCRSSKSAAV